jgi:CubicO group peptidase (beta-lactamase class C family)
MNTIANQLPRSAPEAQGISSSAILAFIKEAEAKIHELHSLMLLRHGHVVAEGWWSPYGPEHPHMLWSLSKSFTSTAVGLAVAEGRLSVDDPVLSFFPEAAPAEISDNLAAMRVRHLLSMSTGQAEDTTDYLFQQEEGNWAKAFLARPVEHEPGAPFVYNSGATYMLSAIVQKLTGLTVLDYLRPRLFEPLGIGNPTWESCPRGINVGGWGLNIKTEDIARFGQLYLQKGIWGGQRLVPEAWVAEASSRQVANGSNPDSDWEQGYGYQFWRCRHGAYRGDGAFGQFCLVMPDQAAVLAITAGVADMQAVLNLVWECLLPALAPAPLPKNGPAQAELERKLAGLALLPPPGAPASPLAAKVSGRTYRFEANEQKVEAISFDFGPDGCLCTIWAGQDKHQVACGSDVWLKGTTSLDSRKPRRVAARGAWPAEDTYLMKLCFYETSFCPTITCRFIEDRLLFDFKANVAFGPTERPQLAGRME